jgi:hypothetical protein
MFSMLQCLGCSMLACVTIACGASDGPSDSSDEGLGTAPTTQAAIDAQLSQVRQSLGEATCASTAADQVLDITQTSYVQSPTATYDHPSCRNGYVVDLPNAAAGHALNASVNFQPADPFTCILNWSYIALYQKQAAGYVKVGENIGGGKWGLGRFGGACSAIGTLTTPAAGDYKVVVASGNLFGGRYAVRFTYMQ